jgi:outer membrane receptor for monomeric catechols
MTSPNAAVLELRAHGESVDVTVRAPTAVVSSPKYRAPLRDIPQTIEVIPRAAMEAQGVTTLSEALRNVPGITLQAGEGGGASSTAGDMFNMRGFNASNSLFVDGLVEYAVNQHLTLRMNIYSLTDTVYIRNVNNNGGRYNPGNPRTAQLTSVIAF